MHAESTNRFVKVSIDQSKGSVECKFLNYEINQTECGIVVFGPHGSCDISPIVIMTSSNVSTSDTVVIEYSTHNLPFAEYCFIVTASALGVNGPRTVKVKGTFQITSETYSISWHCQES